MGKDFQVKNHKLKVDAQMTGNVNLALNVLGIKLVERALDHMDNRFGRYTNYIHDTGNLMRSITYGNQTRNSIDVGTNVEYAEYVHEGTRYMEDRPFLRDACTYKSKELEEIVSAYLKRGF